MREVEDIETANTFWYRLRIFPIQCLNVVLSFIARTYWILISTMVFIPLSGLIWQCLYPNDSIAFARSGALLIAFTLTMAWHNHSKEFIIEKINRVLDFSAPVDTKSILKKPRNVVGQGNPDDSGMRAEARQVVFDKISEDLAKKSKEARKKVDELSVPIKATRDILIRENENIVNAEFMGGIFGTLIWGYGDWVGKYVAGKFACLL